MRIGRVKGLLTNLPFRQIQRVVLFRKSWPRFPSGRPRGQKIGSRPCTEIASRSAPKEWSSSEKKSLENAVA
jgi:hypothetical protein